MTSIQRAHLLTAEEYAAVQALAVIVSRVAERTGKNVSIEVHADYHDGPQLDHIDIDGATAPIVADIDTDGDRSIGMDHDLGVMVSWETF